MSDSATVKSKAMSSDELDRVVGGIIIIGGSLRQQFVSPLERVAINPQPLPPGGFSFARW
jgi:hypothetical protein